MKVRWPWRWDEKLLNQDAKRGTQKKKERTPTRHTWPGAGKPWKGKGKEERRVDGHGTRPAEGGGGRKRLNQPGTAKTYKHLSTRRSQPTWGGKNTWDRGPMGISWWNHKIKTGFSPKIPKCRAIVPCTGTVVKSCPNWHKTAFKFQRIRCTICFTSPDNHKKRDHTWKSCACVSGDDKNGGTSWKRRITVRPAVTLYLNELPD